MNEIDEQIERAKEEYCYTYWEWMKDFASVEMRHSYTMAAAEIELLGISPRDIYVAWAKYCREQQEDDEQQKED